MSDRFGSDARYALIQSWNSPRRFPRSYFSSSTVSWQTCNKFGEFVTLRRVGVITQAEGHYVPCFGFTVRGDVPSFGVLNIHLASLDFPVNTVYAHSVGSSMSFFQMLSD